MKKVFLILLFCSVLSRCFALSSMTDDNMMKAIQYGISSKQDKQTLYQLIAPWLIPERNLKNPYRQKENIFVYRLLTDGLYADNSSFKSNFEGRYTIRKIKVEEIKQKMKYMLEVMRMKYK